MCTCMYGGMNVRTYVRAHACPYVYIVDELEAINVENCFWNQHVCVCEFADVCQSVWTRESQKEKETERQRKCGCVYVCVCV